MFVCSHLIASGLLAACSWRLVQCHLYVELIELLDRDTPTGLTGYPRGYVDRSIPTFDLEMTHLLPADGKPLLEPSDRMCSTSQSIHNQTYSHPLLRSSAGSVVSLHYREGGHISLARRRPEKLSTGSISVYGTAEPTLDAKFLDVHSAWNSDQTGGDRTGRLLARSSFDDGICFENNDSPLSRLRQEKRPLDATLDEGGHRICSISVQMPSDLDEGTLYTLYWVWDWPSVQEETGQFVKDEVYTTCIDIEIR